jgi:hypothetical protein
MNEIKISVDDENLKTWFNMKMTLLIIFLMLTSLNLHADKNWIEIEPRNKKKTQNLDINLSQVEPINKMMKNAMVIKQLIDSSKKEKPSSDNKKWFVLNADAM